MEALQIIAQSWPIAIMVLGAIAGCIALYVIRSVKQSDREDKAYRSTQAVAVRDPYRDD